MTIQSRGSTTTTQGVIDMQYLSFVPGPMTSHEEYHSEYDKSTDWDKMDLGQG